MMMSAGNMAKVHDARGPEAFAQLLELERHAEQIFCNAPQFVPGLLQRSGYSTGILRAIASRPDDGQDLDARVRLRLERAAAFEERLRGPNPPRFYAAIDEGVLRRHVGGAEALRDQIDHLIAISDQDNVHLAIIPLSAGAYPGQVGTFDVYQYTDGQTAQFLEGVGGDEMIVSDQTRVRSSRELVERLVSSTTRSETRHTLEKIAGEL